MNNTIILHKKRTATKAERYTLLVKLLSLIILVLGFTLLGQAATGHEKGDKTQYPNAIHITAQEMAEMMNGNDPYGLLNYLSLQTG